MNPDIPIIDLSKAPGERASWGRSRWVVYLWGAVELLFVYNPWQVSSSLRVFVLRRFGAVIGQGVIFRPRTRVKFPWKLEIGDRSWVGEGVWIHNQDMVRVGHDVVLSQGAFLTTGSHALRSDMALITSPISIEAGAWVTSGCVVLGGTSIGQSSVIAPLSVASGEIGENGIYRGNPAVRVGSRFSDVIGDDSSGRFPH